MRRICPSFHQTDESVLQAGCDLPPLVWLMTERRDGAFERGGVVSAHVQRIAESDRLLHTGRFAQLFGELRQIRAAHRPSRQANARNHFLDGAVREQFAVGNVSQPVAALSFIHVMRGDEKRQACGGKLMDLLPEIAARFRIHARRRLVQQQQFRLMNEAGRQRETLFPSAGKLAGELVFALREPQLLDAVRTVSRRFFTSYMRATKSRFSAMLKSSQKLNRCVM